MSNELNQIKAELASLSSEMLELKEHLALVTAAMMKLANSHSSLADVVDTLADT